MWAWNGAILGWCLQLHVHYYFHNPFLNYKSFNLRDRNKYIHTYISSNQFNNFQLLFSRHVVVGLHLYFKIYFVSKILLISLESVQIRGLRVVMYFFYLVPALFWDCSLCWDHLRWYRRHTLTKPCLAALYITSRLLLMHKKPK